MKQNPDALIGEYLRTFAEANPRAALPWLSYEKGWYVFRAEQGYMRGRYRREHVEKLKRNLKRRIRERTPNGGV